MQEISDRNCKLFIKKPRRTTQKWSLAGGYLYSRSSYAPNNLDNFLEKFNPIQKKVDEITVEDPVIIVKVVGNIHPNDDLLEKVAR